MAEQVIISPGVFTRQNDVSYLPTGINSIGAAIVGPTVKGPAFVPINVNSNQRVQIFGDVYPPYYSTYAAKQYLRQADSVTIVKTLWQDQYSGSYVYLKDSNDRVVAVLGATMGNQSKLTSSINAQSSSMSAVTLSVAGQTFNFSLTSSDSTTYLPYVLSSDPRGKTSLYIHKFFPEYASTITSVTASSEVTYYGDYNHAETPWIISQYKNGANHTQLFKIHSIGDGNYSNTEFKVAIINVVPGKPLYGQPYGTFGVIIRKYDDQDSRPVILQQFNGVNLDPNSTQFIGRIIGNRYQHFSIADNRVVVQGDYPNKSKYIRVQLSDDVVNASIDPSSMPVGFDSLYSTVASSLLPSQSTIFNTASTTTKTYGGFNYSNTDALQYIGAIALQSIDGDRLTSSLSP